jgi:hypothetical protein
VYGEPKKASAYWKFKIGKWRLENVSRRGWADKFALSIFHFSFSNKMTDMPFFPLASPPAFA